MDLNDAKKLVDIINNYGKSLGYAELHTLSVANEQKTRELYDWAATLLKKQIFHYSQDQLNEIMLYVLSKATTDKNAVTLLPNSPTSSKLNDALMRRVFEQIQPAIHARNYDLAVAKMVGVAHHMIMTLREYFDPTDNEADIDIIIRSMKRLHAEVTKSIGATKHENVSSVDLLKSATEVDAPQAGVDPILTDVGFREKLDTETFPTDNVTADLFDFAALTNQETPLSDPSLRIHKETRDLLNQMASLGSHPFFKFIHHPNEMFEIQLLSGSNLMYKKPIEIAKIIYGLMHHSDTKQIKYPAEMGIPQTSALASLVADINSNFTVLQRELDQLKPKTLKRIADKFYNAQARKVAHTAKSVQSELGALHSQRVKQLNAKVDEVLRAKHVYNGTKDTPGVRNRHNFRIIEDRSEELKRIMREIKREPHSPDELKVYKGIAEGAQQWSIGKHMFRSVRHAIWDGGKRTRRAKKNRLSI